MSREIDERVVQMKFESGQFEKNIQTSIHSLDELKKGMDFQDAVKGFDKLDRAARDVDIGALGRAAEQVKVKFGLLEVFTLNVMNRISNAAINTGERLIKSLSIDQITPGWDKYADKTVSVATIMSATAKEFTDTGVQMQFVNEQLDKLNWFTDETSYNFVDMVNNIGKFTSNNISLDKSVTAMQGIANWAAISGANANEASRAMYNLSQAISSGSLKLQDWMSIENANMGTAAFKEMAIQSAVAAGTLIKNGEKITTANGKVEVSVTKFRDTLSKGWLSADVLMATLNEYGAATNKLNEIYEAHGILTSDIVSGIDDYTQGLKTAQEVSEDWGITLEETQKYLEEFNNDTMQFGLKAFKAAQEAKTFEDAINSVKDAVSTGWMKSFEYIFGDYQEAKELWTDLANNLYDIFATGSEARNEMLKDWKALGGRDVLIDSIWMALADILAIINPIKDAWYDVFGKMSALRLTNLTYRLHQLLENLYLTEEASDGLRRTMRGLFAVLDIIKTLIGGGVRIVFETLQTIFGDLNINILGFTGNIGDSVVAFRDWLKEGKRFDNFITLLVTHIKNGVTSVKNFVNAIKEFGPVKAVINSFENVFTEDFHGISSIIEFVLGVLQRFWNFLKQLPSIRSFGDLKGLVSEFAKSVKLDLDDVGISFEGLGDFVKSIFTSLSDIFTKFSLDMTGAASSAASGLNFLSNALSQVDWAGVALMATGIALLALMWKFVDTLTKLASALTTHVAVLKSFKGMADSIKGYFDALKKNVKTNNILKIAIAVGILAASFILLSRLNWEEIGKAAVGLIGIGVGLAALGYAVSKFPDKGFQATILAISASLLILVTALNAINVDNNLAGRMKALGVLIAALIGVVIIMGKVNVKSLPGIAGFIGLAVGLMAMVTALNKLAKMDVQGIYAALPILAGITLLMAAFIKLTSSSLVIGEKEKVKTLTSFGSVLAIALALNLVINAIKKLGKTDPEVLAKGILALIPILGSMTLLFAAARLAGKNASKAGTMILAISVALNLLIPAIKGLGKISSAELERGMAAITGISAIFGALMAVSAFSGANAHKAGLMFIEMAAAMALLQLVIKTLGKVDSKELFKGVVAISTVMLAFAPLIKAANGTFTNETIKSLTSITIIVGMLGGILTILSIVAHFGIGELLSASGALSALFLSLAGFMKIANGMKVPRTGDMAVIAGFLTWTGIILGILAGVTDPQNVLAAAGALSAVMLAVAASGVILQKAKFPTVKQAAALAIYVGAIGAAISALAGVVAIINASGSSINGLLMLTTGVSEIILALSVATRIMGNVKSPSIKATLAMNSWVVSVGILIGSLAAVMGHINKNGGSINGMIELSTAMSEILVALAVSARIVGKQGNVKLPDLGELLKLGAIVTALGGIIAIFSRISDPSKVIPFATAMSAVMLALSATLKIVSTITGQVDGMNVAMLGGVTLIASVMGIILATLSNMVDPDKVLPIALGLSGVMLALSAVVKILASTPPAYLTGAWSSLGMLGTIVAALGALTIAIGYLIQDPAFAKALSDSETGMIAFGKAIGGFIGGIVGGSISGALSFLPDVGTYLTQFMQNAQGFFDGVNNLPDGLPATVAAFAGALLALTAADVLSGLANFATSIFGSGDDNLPDTFERFGKAITAFSDALGDDIDVDKIQSAANAGKSLAELENALPRKGGTLQDWLGEKDLATFSLRIGVFAAALRSFADIITEGDGIDTKAVTAAADAGMSLAKLEDALPPHGGILQDWLGEKDLQQFGRRLVAFGLAIRSFSIVVSGVTKKGVQGAVDAGTALAKLEKLLPPQGGVLQTLIGSSSFDNFGPGLLKLGVGLRLFSIVTTGINIDAINTATTAIKTLVNLEKEVDTSGGWGEIFTGKSDFSSFGTHIKSLGDALSAYSASLEKVNVSKMITINAVISVMLENALKPASGMSTFAVHLTALKDSLSSYSSAAASLDLVKMEATRQAIEDLMRLAELTDAATWVNQLILQSGVMITKLISSVERRYPDLKDAGQSIGYWLIAGVKLGIEKNTSIATNAVTILGTRIVQAFEARLEIASPSAVMAEDGKWIVRGIAEGITNDTSAEDAIVKKANNIKTAFANATKDMSLAADTASLRFQLWQLTEGKNATDSEVFEQQLKVHQADLDNLLMSVQTQQAMAESLRQLYGEQATEYKEAMNDVIKAQIELIQKVDEVNAYQGSIDTNVAVSDRERMKSLAERTKEYAQLAEMMGWTDEEARANAAAAEGFDLAGSQRYQKILDENREVFEFLGWSTQKIEEYAREQSGFTGFGVEETKRDIIDTTYYVEEAMKEQSVTIEQAVSQTTTKAVTKGVSSGVKTASQNLAPQMNSAGEDSGKNYTEGITNALKDTGIISKITSGAEKLGIQVDDWTKVGLGVQSPSWKAHDNAEYYIQGLANGLDGSSRIAINAATRVANQVIQPFERNINQYRVIGQQSMQGFTNGINQMGKIAITAATSIANQVAATMRAALDIRSPSRVTREIGNRVGEGFGLGIMDKMAYVNEASEDIGNNAVSTLDYAYQAIDNIIKSEDDFFPVITPVLDFDQLKAQAGSIGGILGTNRQLSLTASRIQVGAIAAQNSSFTDQNGSGRQGTQTNYNFTQNNYSPKALNRLEIYRQTRNEFARLKGATRK